MVVEFVLGVLLQPPVLNHLVDTECLWVTNVVRVAELWVELHARVQELLHLGAQLVVELEVYFDDVGFNQFFILTAHPELSFIPLGIFFKLEFFEFLINFISPVLC